MLMNLRCKLGWGQQKSVKVSGTDKKQLEEHAANYSVNCKQVSNMIRYKKSTLERQSLSEVKMGRGSATCEKTVSTKRGAVSE